MIKLSGVVQDNPELSNKILKLVQFITPVLKEHPELGMNITTVDVNNFNEVILTMNVK